MFPVRVEVRPPGHEIRDALAELAQQLDGVDPHLVGRESDVVALGLLLFVGGGSLLLLLHLERSQRDGRRCDWRRRSRSRRRSNFSLAGGRVFGLNGRGRFQLDLFVRTGMK